MKIKNILILLVSVVGILNLSMEWNYGYEILTRQDFELQKSQSRPALSSALSDPDYWESYNLWQCFPKENVEVACIKVCYRDECISESDWGDSLTFLVQPPDGALYEFYFEDDEWRSCSQTMELWQPYLENQEAVCIYAAYLQDIAVSPEENIKRRSYWVIDHFKTTAGRWPLLYHEEGD